MDSIPKDLGELIELLKSAAVKESGELFRLSDRQMARVIVERREHSAPVTLERVLDEYPRAHISLDVPRIEQAIIAAVTALRHERVEDREMLKARRQLPAARWTEQALLALAAGEQEPEEPASTAGATIEDAFGGFRFKLADELLGHYRPDFRDMTPDEQSNLIIQVIVSSNKFMDALRNLALTIQHANPNQDLPRSPVKKASRDVRAAELREIDGLSFVEIGKRLSIRQSKHEITVKPYDNREVRKVIVPNGIRILKAALGQDGYDRYVETSKIERQRHHGLSHEELQIERFAAIVKIPADRMRNLMEVPPEEFKEGAKSLDEQQRFLAEVARAAWQTLPH